MLWTEFPEGKTEAGLMIDDSCNLTEEWRITFSLFAVFKAVRGL